MPLDRRSSSLANVEETLRRIDYDVRVLERDAVKRDRVQAEVKTAVEVLKTEVAAIKVLVEKLVTRHEFDPVKLLVYGMAGTFLAGIGGAILSKVLSK